MSPGWTPSSSWFRALPADQRSWVTLVAQTGLASLVEWLRAPDEVLRLTGEVFRSAPRELARSVTLQQTVELVQQTIAVAEEQLPLLADEDDQVLLREEMLLFSREIAFAAARVYASVAEVRGAWDARLEALVIEGLVRGSSIVDDPVSQLAALGWRSSGPITAIVGPGPTAPASRCSPNCTEPPAGPVSTRWPRCTAIGWSSILGGVDDPLVAATALMAELRGRAGGGRADRGRCRRGERGHAGSAVGAARGAGVAGCAASGQRRRAAARAGPRR